LCVLNPMTIILPYDIYVTFLLKSIYMLEKQMPHIISSSLPELLTELQNLANPDYAEYAQRFFKTGPGEYGEGDKFLGIRMPVLRGVARQYKALEFSCLTKLLASEWHEERMVGALILLTNYQKSKLETEKKQVYSFLVAHRAGLNNWDLVDVIVPKTIGDYALKQSLQGNDVELERLKNWAQSDSLWERRIAMLASFAWIRAKEFDFPLYLAEFLLQDKEDLMHKAVGWMLRELGKRECSLLEVFLEKNKCQMPRTMLRYSIEKFSKEERQYYLSSSRLIAD